MHSASSLPSASPRGNPNTPHSYSLSGQQSNMSLAAVQAFSPHWPQASAPHTPISRTHQKGDKSRTPSTPRTQRQTPNLLHSGPRFADTQGPKSLMQHSEKRAGRLAGVGLRLSEDVPHTGWCTKGMASMPHALLASVLFFHGRFWD